MIKLKSNSKKQRNNKNKSPIPFRLNLLFFGSFVCFALLIFRLAYLQIVSGEEYEAEVQRTETTLATGSVPRGEIYDASHRKLVGNEARQTITYTRGSGVSSKDMAKLSLRLAEYIDMPNTTQLENKNDYAITTRDLKDFWLVRNQDKVVEERLQKKEKEWSGAKAYQAQIEKVTEEDVLDLSDTEKEAAAIFSKMNGAYALTTINIKNDQVTDDEIARVSENLNKLPGIDTGTDWVRTYPQDQMLSSILGSVTTEKEGIPASEAAAFLAKGYARNDRVGKSQIEKQYESVLAGTKSKSETETNKNGDVINTTEKYAGEKGDNLVLTINMDFQESVEKIAQEAIKDRQGFNKDIYIVATNPKTGAILAMTGQEYNSKEGKVQDVTLATLTKSFEMGSAIKGATVLSGYMDGALKLDDNVLIDEPLKFAGTPEINSVFNKRAGNRIPMNDIEALERSSNVYMSKVALRMGGRDSYSRNQALKIDSGPVLTRLRDYFSQFGLGVPTGIDLPSESKGLPGVDGNKFMYFAFGQYDTYTTMQLAQYASTIANDGKRMGLHLVDEIWSTGEDGELGKIESQIEPKLLNTVNVEQNIMDRVHQGFYKVVNGNLGTAHSRLGGTPYVSAGKTGTAQSSYYEGAGSPNNGASTINKTYVGYAPYDDPEIAIAVVVPYLPGNNTNYQSQIAAKKVLDAYFHEGAYANKANELQDEYKDNEDTETENDLDAETE